MTRGRMVGYEVRRCPGSALAVVPGVAAALGVVGVALPSGWVAQLTGAAAPLAAGMAAAMIAGGEQAVELHLTLPTPYPRTLGRRLALLCAVTAIALAGLVATLAAAGRLRDPVEVLVAAGSLAMLLLGAGVCGAVYSGASGPASAAVFAAWLGKLLVLDRVLDGSGFGAAAAVLIGVTLLIAAYRRLGDPERLMKGTLG